MPKGIFKRPPCSEATRLKMSLKRKGIPKSEEYKKKLSEVMKGIPKSKEHKRKIGLGNKGKILSKETREKISKAKLGKKVNHKLNCKCFICKAKRGEFIGEKNPAYVDGRTKLVDLLRSLDRYAQWRYEILKIDNYTCQKCGEIGRELEVHHIKKFSQIFGEFLQIFSQFSPMEDKEILLRLAETYEPFWDTKNGETLCKTCHKLTNNYRNKNG